MFLNPGTQAREIYGKEESEESFRCNFGLNPKYFPAFEETSFRFSGKDEDGAPRLMELTDHPFYMGTLFLPQLRSDASHVHPIIDAYVDAVVENAKH